MKSAQVAKIAFTVLGTLIIAQYLSFEICAVVGVLVFIGAIFFLHNRNRGAGHTHSVTVFVPRKLLPQPCGSKFYKEDPHESSA